MRTSTPSPPAGLQRPGRKLWRSITRDYELAYHEQTQLEEACRCRDRITSLRALVDEHGEMIKSSQGLRLHPGIAEIRAQQLALARILATLGVPPLSEDTLPRSTGVRGVYTARRDL